MTGVRLKIVVLFLLLLVAGGTAYAGLSDGLVRYYPFNGNPDDQSGTGNHSTISGDGVTPTTDRCGNPDKAYHFDSGDYIVDTANGLPTNNRTVSLWFRPEYYWTGNPHTQTLLGYGGGEATNQFMIGITMENIVTFAHYTANGCLGAGQAKLDEWHHLVIVINDKDISFHVNGEHTYTCTSFGTPTGVQDRNILLGTAIATDGIHPGTDFYITSFKGSLDDIRIYNRALSESEIAQLYDESCLISPTVTITAPDALAWEGGPSSGAFMISRTGDTDKRLIVRYTITGTAAYGRDYLLSGIASPVLRGYAVIPKNASFISLIVNPLRDRRTEGDETIVVTLKPTNDYQIGTPDTATVTIKDYK